MTDISELVKRMRGLAEYVDDCDAAADALEAQAERIAELEELIGNVNRGVQSCRVDINMAVVWLPAIQRIHEYLRNKAEEEEDARAALAVAEPVIREQCAKIAENYGYDVSASKYASSVGAMCACGAANDIAAAIREGKSE